MASITGIQTPCPAPVPGSNVCQPCQASLPNNDIVDISIRVIHHMGLFAEEYKAWIMHGNNPTNTMDFAAFCTFWETTANIMSFTAILALQHGCGMNAIEDDASTACLTNAVSKFGMAYTAMQESLCNKNASINVMQGQIQMLRCVFGWLLQLKYQSGLFKDTMYYFIFILLSLSVPPKMIVWLPPHMFCPGYGLSPISLLP
jgi:hypothetical protein